MARLASAMVKMDSAYSNVILSSAAATCKNEKAHESPTHGL